MANTLKVKRSAVPGKVPAVTDLELGELAINTYDGKLFLKKDVNGTAQIVDVSSGITAQGVLDLIKLVDGAGSGLDADLLDGLSGSDYARSAVNVDITSLQGITGGISTAQFLDFSTTNNVTPQRGRLWYSPDDDTLNIGHDNGIVQQVGQEFFYPPCKNTSGTSIPNGRLVMSTGSQGDKITIAPAVTNGTIEPDYIIGVTTHEVTTDSEFGMIITDGVVRDINTSIWTPGTILYPDPQNPGALTATKPTAPAIRTPIAIVLRQHANTGRIYVRMSVGSKLGGSDSNVEFGTLANNDLIVYNGTLNRWENKAQSTVAAGTASKLATARTLTIGNTGKTFDGSANVSWTLGELGAVVANTAITGATATKITYDSKGLVTSGTTLVAADIPNLDTSKITTGTFTAARMPAFTGDATSTAGTSSLTLANSGVTAATYGGNNSIPSIAVDAKGRVTSASTITPSGTWGISVSGNAATATKLATARSISLAGDVTGSATFDGSANISITATVADNSHSHAIADVSGLQTALDGKQAALGFTPVQQGGGIDQGTNKVYIGWAADSSGLMAQVDVTNFGTSWPISITKNAATATKLQTARALTIGNTGKSFDGSTNVSWSLAEIGAAAATATVNLTGDQTIGGNKTFTGKGTISKSTTVTVGTAGGSDQFEIANAGSGACVMTFHRWGAYAINMGLDTDNVFRLGGWSNGTNTFRFQSDTSGNFTAQGNVTAYSDIRLKTDLQPIPEALDKVKALTGYTYTRIDTGERQTGVVAQEVQAVLPEAVIDNGETLSVAYGNMVGLLVEAIKELKAEVDHLRVQING